MAGEMRCRTRLWGLPSRCWELASAEPPGLLQADGHHCHRLGRQHIEVHQAIKWNRLSQGRNIFQENGKTFSGLGCHESSVSPLCKSHCPHFTNQSPRSELHHLVESVELSWYLDHIFQSLIASVTFSCHALNFCFYTLVLALILQSISTCSLLRDFYYIPVMALALLYLHFSDKPTVTAFHPHHLLSHGKPCRIFSFPMSRLIPLGIKSGFVCI